MRKLISLLVLLLALTTVVFGQNQSQIARASGRFYVNGFNTWQAKLFVGVAGGPGVGLVVGGGAVVLKDGTLIYPFNTNAPLIWDYGQAGAENVATVGVVGCASYSTIEPPACGVAATLARAHGRGAIIRSGTAGLQETINYAFAKGGGIVVIDQAWTNDGGTDAMIGGAAGYYNVVIEDLRGPVPQWKALTPTVLASIAAPAVRSAVVGNTEVRPATVAEVPVGTFANAAQFVCVTYVDPLGGESACSPTYNFAQGSAVLGMYFASPAASAGAVGWRAYAGLTYALAYQLPITAANCTLSTLVGVYPACAMGARAVFAGPSVITQHHPGYVVNTHLPNTQAHATMAYVPRNSMLLGPIQQSWGPFTASGAATVGQFAVLGTVPLPLNYLNAIGKSIRVHGRITLTSEATTTPDLYISLGPDFAAGVPTTACRMTNTLAMGAVIQNFHFSCTITTNGVGVVGPVMTDGYMIQQVAGTTVGSVSVDYNAAAVASNVQSQQTLYVVFVPRTAGITTATLQSLNLDAVN